MNHSKITYTQALHAAANAGGSALGEQRMHRLSFGEVTVPTGWLHRQMELMADGMTGRLPEYGPFFRKERNGFLYPETKAGWEEIPYWLRGFYPMAALLADKTLLKQAQVYFEALFASRQDDGWFGPAYLKEYDHTEEGAPLPDLFPSMMLLDVLILYYEKTKDDRALDLMDGFFGFCRALSEEQFLPRKHNRLKWQKIRAGDMLPSIYWYYRKSGKEWLLPLAKRFYDGIWESSMPEIAHHAVDFAQRFAYSGIYSQQSGEQSDFEASEQAYRFFKDKWGQMPRGIFAADEQIREGCTDPRQGYEPCGMVELAKNFYELGRISGDTKYADRAEDVMLNHFPASFTADYRQLHYLTSCNLPILSNDGQHPTMNGSFGGNKSYEIFTPNNRCCGHNTGMGWPWYVMNLWQRSGDGGLVAWLYSSCEVCTEVNGKRVKLEVTTDYPFRGSVYVKVLENECKDAFPLYFRIPAWSTNAVLSVNGKQDFSTDRKGGYIRYSDRLKAGDVLVLCFGMEISTTKWENNGSVSVDLGPLTYSVKIGEDWRVVKDAREYKNPKPYLFENLEVYPTSPWNYGLCTSNGSVEACIRMKSQTDNVAEQPWTPEAAPIVLSAWARRISEWVLEDDMAAELQPSPAYSTCEVEEIEMIPLGCARLRMSCLPTVSADADIAARWSPAERHVERSERPKAYPTPYKLEAPQK